MTNNIESLYSIEIYKPNGDLLVDMTGLAQLRTLEVQRNKPGSADFEVDLNVFEDFSRKINIAPLSIFAVNVNEIRIKRGSRYLWGGQIAYIRPSLTDNRFSVKAIGFLDLFRKRYTASERVFTGVDRGIIAKTLIDETQALTNGDFGIDTHVDWVETTGNSDRTYSYDEVYEKIIQLTEVIDGFDCEITPDKKFYVYAEQGIDRSSRIKFEYPGNIKNIEFERNGEDMVNEVILFGNGITETRSDATYQTTYKLRQKKMDYPSIINNAPLQDHGDEELRINKNFKDLITGIEIDGTQDPFIGSYWLGDRIKVLVNNYRSFSSVNDVIYKIDGITISIDENLTEIINLELSLP